MSNSCKKSNRIYLFVLSIESVEQMKMKGFLKFFEHSKVSREGEQKWKLECLK